MIVSGAALVAASCVNPFAVLDRIGLRTGGRVTVSTNMTAIRTVIPDLSAAFDSFEVTLMSHDGYDPKTATVNLPASAHTFDSVESGTWDINVTAKKGGVTVGGGTSPGQSIAPGTTINVVVPISILQDNGTGSLSLSVSVPLETDVDYVEGVIDGTILPLNLTQDGSYRDGTFVRADLAAGSHSLVMTFTRGGPTGTPAGTFIEAVNIWPNLTSDRWIDGSGQAVPVRDFTAADFLDANASLLNLQISAGSISFDPSTYNYDGGSTTAPKVTVVATGAVPGQTLQYQVNGGGWSLPNPSGAASTPLPLGTGPNTVDVLVTAPDRATTRTYSVTLTRVRTIIDHTNFDPSTLSDQEVAQAALLNVYFEHASVGGNIFSDGTNGFDTLRSAEPRYTSGRVHWDIEGDWPATSPDPDWYSGHQSIADWVAANHGLTDVGRGNPGAETKLMVFRNSMLWTSLTAHLDVASFKFCWIDNPAETPGTPGGSTMFDLTRTEMEELEAANPGIIFLWWTQPLESNVAYDDRQTYNDLVRAYCAERGKWLLDLADLESHDDSGTAYVDSQNRELLFSGYTPDWGHLYNPPAVKMAKAYWKLIGEIAKLRQ